VDVDVRGPWSEYRRLVLASLTEIGGRLDKIEVRLSKIEEGMTVQKVKMGMISAATGALFGAAVAALVRWVVP
jgi:hypothetical protein